MRDLLDILNKFYTLNESTGLAGRKPGDPFASATGNTLTFNDIKFFPEEGGKYSPEELDQVIEEVSEQTKIQWQNKRTSKSGGFALASFSSGKQTVTIGRFLDNVKPDPRQNSIDNKFVVNGEAYSFASKSAQKEQSGLSPLDLLQDRTNQTVPSIMNQLAKNLGTDNPLYAVAHHLATGSPLPMTFKAPEGVSFAAFRDYFCEILQPIALQKGQFTGNASDAADRFLDGTFNGTFINYGATKTGGLTDSELTTKDGKKLLISSKGGKGAEASSKNLYDEVQKLQGSDDGRKLLKKFGKEVKLLEDIIESGMHGAPLKVGIDVGIITPEEAEQVKGLKNLPNINIEKIDGLNLSDNLKKLAKDRETDNPSNVNMYFHVIAAIANKVAEKVNTSTNFSKAAATILNNGALVQIYTKAKDSGGNWTLQEFQTVYPSDAIKGVFLSAGKNYYSTAIKGNFTFMIDKSSASAPPAKSATTPTSRSKSKSLGSVASEIVRENGVGRTLRR